MGSQEYQWVLAGVDWEGTGRNVLDVAACNAVLAKIPTPNPLPAPAHPRPSSPTHPRVHPHCRSGMATCSSRRRACSRGSLGSGTRRRSGGSLARRAPLRSGPWGADSAAREVCWVGALSAEPGPASCGDAAPTAGSRLQRLSAGPGVAVHDWDWRVKPAALGRLSHSFYCSCWGRTCARQLLAQAEKRSYVEPGANE